MISASREDWRAATDKSDLIKFTSPSYTSCRFYMLELIISALRRAEDKSDAAPSRARGNDIKKKITMPRAERSTIKKNLRESRGER